MRFLTRPPAPACLAHYQHGRDNWGTVTPADKTDIWAGLNQMQQHRCAYCECHIDTGPDDHDAHIEHFRQRSRYPQGTFDWANLFGSCNRDESCGKYKDRQAYQHQDLLKPDIEDPEHLLRFLPDGQVVPANNLAAHQRHRAEETIRIFNLNGVLRRIRENHVKGYLQTAEEFAEMAEAFDEHEWLPLLQAELDAIQHLPFATAIKHTLLPA
jgi:uncharacterized protein (TIGR02646 family)